ncbi:MAG: hypothetical protein QNJ72_31370 [Pleurocapsa sp. MO_226.B13]|nr:hypothetical protein [Pleurocapsa sp. MO_226.B13]
MKYYSIFSIGDYQSADFAGLETGAGGARYYFPKARKTPEIEITPKAATQDSWFPKDPVKNPAKAKATSTPGVRKGHIRNVGGKAVMVGQSILKAGKSTAGKLATGAAGIGTAGMAAGQKYGGQAVNLVKSNPKTAAIAAGGTVLAGGAAGYLATRKKRKRR